MTRRDEPESSLRLRFAALCDEIRRYPTPIARCDEQLAALLEQRSELHARLAALQSPAPGCRPINVWINDGGSNGT